MVLTPLTVERPRRWDVPFDEHMTPERVKSLLEQPPFSQMDPSRFPPGCPLEDLLLNDTRIRDFEPGEVLVREGEYANSAFLLLLGEVRMVLHPKIPPEKMGADERPRKSRLGSFWSWLQSSSVPEGRSAHSLKGAGLSGGERDVRVKLQDVPALLEGRKSAILRAGDLFGEVAALNRMPQPSTVLAGEHPARVLEIRWQGLRELLKRAPAFREQVDAIYRERSLKPFLRAHPLFEGCTEADLRRTVEETRFESYGDYEWSRSYQQRVQGEGGRTLDDEPVILEEGHYAEDVVMIRSGFARISRRKGIATQTTAYVGSGAVFGLEEVMEGGDGGPRYSARLQAVGYTHILRIPRLSLPTKARPPEPPATSSRETPPALPGDLMEFFGENRFQNGTQTMLIQMDRCTRCDDCVRACAGAHDQNPRFVRSGPVARQVMVANACMHCQDPVCMLGCPTGAIHRDERTGNIVIDDPLCIGCGACSDNCPYEAIRMVEIRDRKKSTPLAGTDGRPIMKATKCDLCHEHKDGPACVRACPHDALFRVNMSDQEGIRKRMGL